MLTADTPNSEQALLADAAYLSPDDTIVVRRALAMAQKAHAGKVRIEGCPYVEHAIAVARILASWHAPVEIVATGLLHDVLKENYAAGVSLAMVEAEFGPAVSDLVHEVSRLGRLGHIYPASGSEDRLDSAKYIIERLPWVASALSRSPLAVVVKIADRLHNAQSTHVHVPERKYAFAAGSMNIFVPFAERLGMRAAKRELEDGAFCILQPDRCGQIVETYPLAARQESVAEIVQRLQQALDEQGIPAQVISRARSYYNLYLLETAQRSPVLLHLAHPIVVITEGVSTCYQAMGVIHQVWPPQPDQIRDYIAAPKPNGYRALHTFVRYQPGEDLLIAVRQRQMDLVADFGLTAWWRGVPEILLPTFPAWRDPPPGKINVLTPDGDLMMLTKGATPIDFAYAIHAGLGHQCTGAVINGRMASLNQPLESGDVVKILTSRVGVGPSLDWLDIIKTSKARNFIRRWFKAEKPEEMEEKGWSLLEAQLRESGILLASPQAADQLELVAKRAGFESRQDLLIAIGLGKRKPKMIAAAMRKPLQGGAAATSLQATIVSLARSDLPQRLAACCRPLPPDRIVGYVTSRNAVTIHRADC